MKTFSITLCAIFASLCLATAQTISETTTTTVKPVEVMGTVTTFDPAAQSIVLTTEGAPVTYGYTTQTVVVDELGNPVAIEAVRSGIPLTVYYSQVGDRLVVSRVIVREAPIVEETTTTTTTTIEGD